MERAFDYDSEDIFTFRIGFLDPKKSSFYYIFYLVKLIYSSSFFWEFWFLSDGYWSWINIMLCLPVIEVARKWRSFTRIRPFSSSRFLRPRTYPRYPIMEESMDSVRTFNSDRSATLTLSGFNSRRDSNRNSVDDPDYAIRKERSRSITRENSLRAY